MSRSHREPRGRAVGGSSPARVPADENHVHRAARADRALEFATVAPDGATVFDARELAPQLTREKRRLHEMEGSA